MSDPFLNQICKLNLLTAQTGFKMILLPVLLPTLYVSSILSENYGPDYVYGYY